LSLACCLGLRRIDLFQGLGEERLEAIARGCAWRNCAPGMRILSRTSRERDVYLLVSGKVRVTTYSAAGRQVTFRDCAPGEIFGELAAIDSLPRSADVVALEGSLLAAMPAAQFRRLLRDEPVLAERVLRRFAGLVRRLSERVIDLSTLGVHERIHGELLRLAREAGIEGNVACIDPAPKHADLASQVSTYREEVAREMSALAKAGVLGKDGRALVVCDVRRLENMAHEKGTGPILRDPAPGRRVTARGR
jgi:CRP/FNR family transcriptional regulator, cyclic AMP receptor protein